MVGQPAVLFFVQLKNFMLIAFLSAENGVGVVRIFYPNTLNGKKISLVQDVLRVNDIEITLTKRKVMDCIKQVRLPHAVISYKTVDFFRKTQIEFRIIFKVD